MSSTNVGLPRIIWMEFKLFFFMYCPRKRRVNGVRFSHLSEVEIIFLAECIIVRELYDLNYGLHNRQFVKLFVFSP